MRFCSCIIFGILLVSSVIMVRSSKEEKMKDWYPKDADIRKLQCDEQHKSRTDNSEYTEDESLREYVLCVARELNVYSKESGLNLKRLAQLTFAKGYLDFRSSNYLIKSCSDKFKAESVEEIKVYKTITCTMDEYQKFAIKTEM